MVSFEARIRAIIEESRVARLVTIDVDDNNIPQPYLVSTVFVFDGKHFFIPFDKKSKKVSIEKSRRLKNIQKNPNVVILIDEYSDDWSKLFFVMIRGSAKIIEEEEKKLLVRAYKLLLLKYPQYKNVGIGRSCIMIDPRKVIFWRNS